MKSIYRILILFFVFPPLLTLAQQRWDVYLGNPSIDDYPSSVIESYDKGYLITGSNSDNLGYLIKTDVNGNETWNKSFQTNNEVTTFLTMAQDSLGGTVLAGDAYNPLILYLNPCGELVWCNKIVNEENFIWGQFLDVKIVGENIYALADFTTTELKTAVYLFNFNFSGNLLWMKQYGNVDNDPYLRDFAGARLDFYSGSAFISGWGGYAYPDKPNSFYPRAMFVKIDNQFNEEWFLPYGMYDSLAGIARGVIRLNDSMYRGFGSYYVNGSDTLNTVFYNLTGSGQETYFQNVPNHSISEEVNDNYLIGLEIMNDSSYLISAKVGTSLYYNPMGEWTMDTGGLVYNYQNHTNTFPALYPTCKTKNDKYVFSVQYQNDNYKDILLYKLNPDLSQAEIDNTAYVYDSLCDNPIVSDTIYLDGCGIITDLRDIPSPTEYYSYISTIPVHIFPNPATSGITFEFGNTEYHKDILLRCYDINGRMVYEQTLPPSQTQIKTSVSNWQSGIYVATASSREGGTGKEKFVVR
ncbi:MAG TPA: T9SS type A sorting domain-containing protein [Bacteroidales bacterium]